MRQSAWWIELKKCLYTMVVSLVFGTIFERHWMFLSIGLFLYVLYTLWQFKRLGDWFDGEAVEVPESRGAWGTILDKIYLIQRRGDDASAKLQAVIDRSRASINALQEGVLLVDRDSNLDWWNKSAGKMLGLQFPEDIDQPMVNLIRSPTFRDYFSRKAYSEPLVIRVPNNHETSFEDNKLTLNMQFTLFGRDERLILVRDVSEIARLEQVRSDFVANVSHELKTPLTVLRGYLETFVDNLVTFDARWHRPVNSMMEQAMRMDGLVEDLLLLSTLESDDQIPSESDIDAMNLIQSVLDECGIFACEKKQTLRLGAIQSVSIRGAYNEIRSALLNLVLNAIKYTQVGGEISVSLCFETTLMGQQGVLLTVEDNGLGIDKKHISRLTERFYRVDHSRSSDTGGTGLGLAIVKHVLIRHQGSLEIESQLDKGSRFICKIPKERVSRQPKQVRQLSATTIH